MYHLGYFLGYGFGLQPWNAKTDGPWVGDNMTSWMKPDLYVDLARSLDRAGFDFLLIEDTAMVEDTFRGSAETALRRGLFAPKSDPLPLVPLLAQQTKNLGIFPTISTHQYPPYLAARLLTTLDHLSDGRVGVNVVTSVSDRVAQNYGHDAHMEHDERYVMADEWVEVVRRLQGSWDPGAVVADADRGIYADHTRVHTIDHQGKYFKSRGPLNTIPGPQGISPIAAAGNSVPGREFAAKNADVMLVAVMSVEEMKAFREDMSARLISHGRKPSDLKLYFIAEPIVEETDADAEAAVEAAAAARWSDDAVEFNLWYMTYVSGGRIDFGQYDLDKPVSDLMITGGNGEQESMAKLFRDRGEQTLREIAATRSTGSNLGLVGSPDTVAGKMDDIMAEVGGDGFLFYGPTTRHAIAKICDGLAPVLRRRGSIRDGYDGPSLRENLRAF